MRRATGNARPTRPAGRALGRLLTPGVLAAVALIAWSAFGQETISSPSSIGRVDFPHLLHAEELGFDCIDCHHETNATRLSMPHENYFDDFWIDCRTCHHGADAPLVPQACSTCHHSGPATESDETLSAKVVIHKSCWSCHDSGTGQEASRSCAFCHRGPRHGP